MKHSWSICKAVTLGGGLLLSTAGGADAAIIDLTLYGTPCEQAPACALPPPASNFPADAKSVSAAVPEPPSWVLMLAGFVGLAWSGYRRNRIAAPLPSQREPPNHST